MAAPTKQPLEALTAAMTNTCAELTTAGQGLRVLNFFPIQYQNVPYLTNVTCYDKLDINGKICQIETILGRTPFLLGYITYTIDSNKMITISDVVTDSDINNNRAPPMFVDAIDALVKIIIFQNVFCLNSERGLIQIVSQHSQFSAFDYEAFEDNNFSIEDPNHLSGGWLLGKLEVSLVRATEHDFYASMAEKVIFGIDPQAY